jgi:hypothetical protein
MPMKIWDDHRHPDDPRMPGHTLAEGVENMGIGRLGLFLRPQ